MYFLFLSVFSSVLLGVLFRNFHRWKVQILPAIVVNYVSCVIVGSLLIGGVPSISGNVSEPWFPIAIVLGLLFVTGFYSVGRSVQGFGVAVATVAQKMSLALSVPFAIVFFGESAGIAKILGVVLAICSVVLATYTPPGNVKQRITAWAWVFLIWTFLCSALIECALQYVQLSFFSPLGKSTDVAFFVFLFGTAGLIGAVLMAVGIAKGDMTLDVRSSVAGLVMGVPNFFSVYFLLRGMEQLEGSLVYPVSNVSVIVSLSIIGFWAFREKLSTINWIGIATAIVAVLLNI